MRDGDVEKFRWLMDESVMYAHHDIGFNDIETDVLSVAPPLCLRSYHGYGISPSTISSS